ncbi:hypothetical protein KJ865_13835 [Myxococcota bacterium]|nr:hypothetical protein [Myxococcota bacterium]
MQTQVGPNGWVHFPLYDSANHWFRLKGKNVITGEEVFAPNRLPLNYGKGAPASYEHPNLVVFPEGIHLSCTGSDLQTRFS